jgi:ribosomal silencing factor RsfS
MAGAEGRGDICENDDREKVWSLAFADDMVGREKVWSLAFADDMVIVAKSEREMKEMMRNLEKYVRKKKATPSTREPQSGRK